MEKFVTRKFNKTVYLLGKDKDGILYYMESGSFNCGWYWGLGSIVTYSGNKIGTARDIDMHAGFDNLFFNNKKGCMDSFNEFFVESVLTDSEKWKLLELIKSLYVAKEYMEFIYRGGSNFTSNPSKEIIKNPSEYDRLKDEVIPNLLHEVYVLLGQK